MSSNSNRRSDGDSRSDNNQHVGHQRGRYEDYGRNQRGYRGGYHGRSNRSYFNQSNPNASNRRYNDRFRNHYNGERYSYHQSNHHQHNYHQHNQLSISNNSFNHSVHHQNNNNHYHPHSSKNEYQQRPDSSSTKQPSIDEANVSESVATSTISSKPSFSTSNVPLCVTMNISPSTSTINSSNWNQFSIKDQFFSLVNEGEVANDYGLYHLLFKETSELRLLKDEAVVFASNMVFDALRRIYPDITDEKSDYNSDFSDCDSYHEVTKNSESQWPYTRDYIKRFISAVSYNIRIDHAFYLESLGKGDTLPGCTSPFVPALKRWRSNFELGESFSRMDTIKGNRLMTPKSMIDSLLAKCCRESKGCGILHLATLLYITKLHSVPDVKLKKSKKCK